MQILVGEILEILPGDLKMARIRVGAGLTRVALEFIPRAKVGDRILFTSGVGLSVIDHQNEEEQSDVSGNSR